MRCLLDTNAYSALRRGHLETADRVRRCRRVLLSTVVLGELEYGFRHGSQYEQNRRELEAFLDHPYVRSVPVTPTTAERFGRIATALRRKGHPIPSNDIWIAAQAMETGADLFTFDRHFEAVDGLAWTLFSKA